MSRTSQAALSTPFFPSPSLFCRIFPVLLADLPPLPFHSFARHLLPRRQTLCAFLGALTTGGCQPFNLAWRLSSASSWSTNFVLIAHGRCNLDDWIGLKRRCTRRRYPKADIDLYRRTLLGYEERKERRAFRTDDDSVRVRLYMVSIFFCINVPNKLAVLKWEIHSSYFKFSIRRETSIYLIEFSQACYIIYKIYLRIM